MISTGVRVLAITLFLAVPKVLLAQTPPPAPADQSQQQLLSAGELDALVAPIALYPDALLSEILMASTYPLEVVEASRWAGGNKKLKGDQLKAAVSKQSWEDSVKALTATPDVLHMMSDKLDWTRKLGDAVLAQQPDVMDAIQRLRQKAQANNVLTSNKQQTVSTQQQGGKQVIVIAPTDPSTIYVPYYNPAVVYGAWPYPAYPPYYWPAPGYIAAGVVATGLAFGAGYALGRWASGGYGWGGGFNWGGGNINVNRPVNVNNINVGSNNNWTHNSVHRQGVRYSNANVAQKFGGNRNISAGAENRMDFRGRNGQQVLQPGGGNRANLGGGEAGGRLNTGDRNPSNRPSGGGNRQNLGGAGSRQNLGSGGNRQNFSAGNRPTPGGGGRGGGNALGNISSGRTAGLESNRGRMSMGGGGGQRLGGGGGGGGGFRGGGGRRSDIRLKHDVSLLGRLDSGIGFYRFAYNGSHKMYVGVMAQEVQALMPEAVARGRDGYLRVFYDKLGLKFQTYDEWAASGARVPVRAGITH